MALSGGMNLLYTGCSADGVCHVHALFHCVFQKSFLIHDAWSNHSLPNEVTLGTAVAQWLRCCATAPDGVIGIFH